MKIYYDTEFIEDGATIDLISIGMVAEDGREYYAVSSDAGWEKIKASDWLVRNVVPSLPVTARKSLDTYLKNSEYHAAVVRISGEFDPGMAGRWRITGIDSVGLPGLERDPAPSVPAEGTTP